MRKILVANRGEIACRVLRSCKAKGIASVAVYSEADEGALHTTLADQAVCIGPAPPLSSYLDITAILEAVRESGATAVHPGYGFLAENAGFARAVEEAGLIWIGPSPDSIEDMGAKDRARAIAVEAGVPVVPGSSPYGDQGLANIELDAASIGYPLLVKAAGGGGGIGMQIVKAPDKLVDTVERTQAMAAKVFANPKVYLERFVEGGRHVEIQVFGDGEGGAIHFFERDCSLQRRYQKIIEEAPAPVLDAELRAAMIKAAVSLCTHTKYKGAGTVEFLVDVARGEFYFLEMNTRIQVEHPVTEMVTGVDLVGLQIDVAHGEGALPDQSQISTNGHAVECRVYAERPEKRFFPSPGQLDRFEMPAESGTLRIEVGYRSGDKVTVHYDPLLAKVVAHGATRTEAIEASIRALEATAIDGVGNNLKFLLACLQHPAFAKGEVFTGFIDTFKDELIESV